MTHDTALTEAPPVAIYALTRKGLDMAARLAAPLGARVYAASSLLDKMRSTPPGLEPHGFDTIGPLMAERFSQHRCHIFITAAGIAVRSIAPHLRGKDLDPAVLVVDQLGRFVISLLSGHLGGANALARRVADILGATPVITTATDAEDLPAIDLIAKERGLYIGNLKAAKSVSAALLAGEPVLLHDPGNRLGLLGSRWEGLFRPMHIEFAADGDSFGADSFGEDSAGGSSLGGPAPGLSGNTPMPPPACVIVTERALPLDPSNAERCLLLHPPVLCAGVGCRRGAAAPDICEAVLAALAAGGFARGTLAFLASLDVKTDEPGLVTAARSLGVPLRFYSAQELAAYEVSSPSPKARERFGVDGVCEPAALAAAGGRGGDARLVCPKRVAHGVTVALARRSGC